MGLVNFKYGTLQQYKNLGMYDTDVLYFLSNGQIYKGDLLMGGIELVGDTFPEINQYNLGKIYISGTTGEIKYAGEDGYENLSELAIDNIVLEETFINKLIEKIGTVSTITMPTLTADGTTVIWTPSNVDEFKVIVME